MTQMVGSALDWAVAVSSGCQILSLGGVQAPEETRSSADSMRVSLSEPATDEVGFWIRSAGIAALHGAEDCLRYAVRVARGFDPHFDDVLELQPP